MNDLTVSGTDELINKLLKIAEAEEVAAIVQKHTAALKAEALRNVPVRTGDLKDSIKSEFIEGEFAGEVSANMPYSQHVEFGTRFQSANPYMGPALHSVKGRFITDMQRLVK